MHPSSLSVQILGGSRPPSPPSPPLLSHRLADDREAVKKDVVHHEPRKEGHRVARDDYRRIINTQGPLLEKYADII